MDLASSYNIHFELSHNKVNAVIPAWMCIPRSCRIGRMTGSLADLIKDNEFRGTNGPFIRQNFGEGIKCLISGNNFQHITDIGIYLGPGTKGCLVIGNGSKTNVVDEGTGNIIIGGNHIGRGVGPVFHFFKRIFR